MCQKVRSKTLQDIVFKERSGFRRGLLDGSVCCKDDRVSLLFSGRGGLATGNWMSWGPCVQHLHVITPYVAITSNFRGCVHYLSGKHRKTLYDCTLYIFLQHATCNINRRKLTNFPRRKKLNEPVIPSTWGTRNLLGLSHPWKRRCSVGLGRQQKCSHDIKCEHYDSGQTEYDNGW